MQRIKISNKWVGEGDPCFVIAEIGSNHDSKLKQAKELIDMAKEAGADAVKFQSFSADGLVSRKRLNKNKWEYNSIFGLVKNFELPDSWHKELFEYCKKKETIFLSTPFEEKKADLLNKIGVSVFKIASGDLNNTPFLKYIAMFKKPIILSTGASYLKEVERAVKLIKNEGNRDIILLHCVSNYPTKVEDFNLRCIITLKKFGLPVGCSDHSLGFSIPIVSVALGAKVIEKHITLSRGLKGPDHSFSLVPMEFKIMVDEIRKIEKALGDGVKRPSGEELSERISARRSIYASRDIPKGAVIKEEVLKIVRHAYGLEPKKIYSLIGRKTKVLIKKDEVITLRQLR